MLICDHLSNVKEAPAKYQKNLSNRSRNNGTYKQTNRQTNKQTAETDKQTDYVAAPVKLF